MKFLVLIVVILLVVWLVRRGNTPSVRTPPAPQKPPALEDMVSCAHCGVHLPRSEAFPGRGGAYCGEAHRSLHERQMAERGK